MAEETGPNDARHVVWAIIKFFYYDFCGLLIQKLYIQIQPMFLMAQGRQVTKTGPNNASGVVWAIGNFFFFSCFIYTNYHIQTGMGQFREGGDDENSFKNRF